MFLNSLPAIFFLIRKFLLKLQIFFSPERLADLSRRASARTQRSMVLCLLRAAGPAGASVGVTMDHFLGPFPLPVAPLSSVFSNTGLGSYLDMIPGLGKPL